MSIATEILRLRRDASSSMAALLAAMEWEGASRNEARTLSRSYDVLRMADVVLLNVAAHAADALRDLPTNAPRKTRRTLLPFWNKGRQAEAGQLQQSRLFA